MIKPLLCFLISTIAIAQESKGKEHLKDLLESAKKENREIMLLFTGSDWCKSCLQLKSNIIEVDAFKKYVNEKMILYSIDFPRDKRNIPKKEIAKREQLADSYNPNGIFPYILILDKNGQVKKIVQGYRGESVENFLKELQ